MGGGVPGVGGTGWVLGEGYTGYYPRHPPGPIFSHIPGFKPYPGPNEGNSGTFNEVSQIGSRIGSDIASELTQNRPRIDPPTDLPDWSPDDPQITILRTSDILRSE